MEYVGGALIESSEGTLPPVQAGDLAIITAIRWDAGAAPTAPSGWTSLHTSTSGYSRRVGYRVVQTTSSSASTSTWTNADVLMIMVWRDATIGVGSSNAAVANNAAVPALTLSSPPSYVAVMAEHPSVIPAVPAGTTSVGEQSVDPRWRISLSSSAVSSWGAIASTTQEVVTAVELIPVETPVGISYSPSWDVEAMVGVSYSPSWEVGELRAALSYSPSWDVEAMVGISYRPSWTVESLGTWRDMILTATWRDAVNASGVVLDSYAELVDAAGNPVPTTVDGVLRDRLPLQTAAVKFSGTQGEQWSADLTFSDPWLVPRTTSHPLWGISPYRLRLWWGVWADPAWLWMPVCTLSLGDVSVTDNGLISGTVRARDMLSTIRGGYTGSINISGEKVSDAIRMIFARCAPYLTVNVADTDELVAEGVVLDGEDPLADIRELVGIGWADGRVWTDREGTVFAGPQPDPVSGAVDWQEGPACVVSEMTLEHTVEHMGNQVTAVSTHPDAGGEYVTVQDDDPSSPTWVGGAWGTRPLPNVTSEKTTTESGLRSLALMALGRGLRPKAKITVTVPQRPDLTYRHPVLLARGQLGVAGEYRVISWELDLPVRGEAPKLMQVSMAQEYR